MADGKIVFIIGGSRSGKTAFAQRLVESWGGAHLYVATAEARDDEMRRRIASHREERGVTWQTLEEPLDLAGALRGVEGVGGVLVDCLTLWTSNLMEEHGDDGQAIDSRVAELLAALKERRANVAIVTNEVGQGIVPLNELSRRFRDLAGTINRKVSLASDEAWLVVAGRALRLENINFI